MSIIKIILFLLLRCLQWKYYALFIGGSSVDEIWIERLSRQTFKRNVLANSVAFCWDYIIEEIDNRDVIKQSFEIDSRVDF